MISDAFIGWPLWRGILLAILGVGFWVGGVVVAHYYWKRTRGEE